MLGSDAIDLKALSLSLLKDASRTAMGLRGIEFPHVSALDDVVIGPRNRSTMSTKHRSDKSCVPGENSRNKYA